MDQCILPQGSVDGNNGDILPEAPLILETHKGSIMSAFTCLNHIAEKSTKKDQNQEGYLKGNEPFCLSVRKNGNMAIYIMA